MIRVVLVDDHPLVRAGLQSLLGTQADLEVVGAASDGAEAVELVLAHRPDVVLMDLSMPGMDGVAATRRIRSGAPEVQILVLSSFSDSARVLDALDAGATGYLLKDVDPEDLLRGVRAAVRGESPLDPRAARVVLRGRTARREALDGDPLPGS